MTGIETVIKHDGTCIVSSATVDDYSGLICSPLTPDGLQLQPEALNTFKAVCGHLYQLNRQLFALILQELCLYSERHLMSGLREWSVDGIKWHEIPQEIWVTGIEAYPIHNLDIEWMNHLQHLVRSGEQPFLASRHLHEARQHRGVRFRWIEATTAAELAIKEALARMEPKLIPLLVELPAPPLTKLYGPILESIAGERSPFLKELQTGIEIRNRLVHRPSEPDPDPQKLADYVGLVDRAIRHLTRICREQNPAIRVDQLHPVVQWDHTKSA